MSRKSDRPNILFIMDDQHRFDYLGCAGLDSVNTPNIDRLASRGVRFTNCFTNSPICVPARIGLASGLQPSRIGAVDNWCSLPSNIPTFYQRFRDHGYRVGCVGKLDLNKPDPYNGKNGDRADAFKWGFTHPEECEGKMHAARSLTPQGPYSYYLQEHGLLEPFNKDYMSRFKIGHQQSVLNHHDSVLPTEHFADIYIGRRTAEWIEKVPDDYPWFNFVSFVGPHDPFDPPTEYAEKYREKDVPSAVKDSMQGKPEWVKNRQITDDPEIIASTRRQYCAAIEVIDDQIGMILDALERRNMVDNTYIIFTSDHGEMLGDHGLYQKSVGYEPALHVPLIISGPDIPEGEVSDALIELIDLNPTVCELAGLPAQENIDAKSFGSILRKESLNHRSDIVSAERNFRVLRTNRYKYIENYNDISELYDLKEDPLELKNLGEVQPELVRKFALRIRQRFL
ncbi:sulfatase [Metabacillus niabensis]|uniref:sulfatase family protein n=1 Tax=Metabacillus niabensis TaxID=324854 RepID=UPI001CFABB5D|nr:sulfatase-like hydrolase/transferase [Metabacillus niabensis]